MNEFAAPGQEPPLGRDDIPAAPGGQRPPLGRDDIPAGPRRPESSPRPDTPIRLRIVWDARIPPPVTTGFGQAERDWFRSLVSPDPGPSRVPGVQYEDFPLSAGDEFVVDCSALSRIAIGATADAINVLLVTALPNPFSFRPYYDMGPGSPVRNPGSDFGP